MNNLFTMVIYLLIAFPTTLPTLWVGLYLCLYCLRTIKK